MKPVCITRIATATPVNDVHDAFVECASSMLHDRRKRSLLRLMEKRSGIGTRLFRRRESWLRARSMVTSCFAQASPSPPAGGMAEGDAAAGRVADDHHRSGRE